MKMTFLAGASAKTTTSQYMAGYISAANTVSVVNTTTAFPIGIIDSYQSSSSETLTVILGGPAKGYANLSIAAGSLLTAVDGGKLSGAITTATSHTLGYAVSSASTNGALTIIVSRGGIL